MHGGPKTVYKNKQHERAMKAPINATEDKEFIELDVELRKKGLL
jgi:hypothetical protein